ncbi:MAG: hypothetical protein ACI8PG_005546, partial [Planctomycetota bacterium]
MKVVYTPSHRDHAPLREFSAGELVPCLEVPERAETIARALTGTKWAEIV